jgi:hypothetical protein
MGVEGVAAIGREAAAQERAAANMNSLINICTSWPE